MKQWQSLALGLIVSVATLAYALHGIDFGSLRDDFANARYIYLLPSILLVIVGLMLRGLRWRALLNGRITLPHAFQITNVGYFFGGLLPFRLGDVARMFLATRIEPPVPVFTSLSSIVVERLTDLLAVVVLVTIAVSMAPVAPSVVTAAQVSGILAVVGLIVLAVLAARRAFATRLVGFFVKRIGLLQRLNVTQWVDRLLDGITPLTTVRGISGALGWTAAAWAVTAIEAYFLMAMFYDKPTFYACFLMIGMGALAVALPAVPGNVGPFEAAVIYGVQLGGMITPDSPALRTRALAYAVTIHIVNTGMYAFMGWIGLQQERVSLRELLRSARGLVSRNKTVNPAIDPSAASIDTTATATAAVDPLITSASQK